LLDKEGALAKLKQEAGAFTWEPLRVAADEYASYDVMGYAEEVHKILSALTKRDESAVLYGTVGLLFGLTRAVAVQRGILIESENSYLRQVQESVGRDSVWTRYHRLAAGFEIGATNRSPAEVRGIAGLALYEETVRLLWHILRPAHLDVIDHTLTAIRESELARPE
jgi:hypothetical protein